MSLILALAVEVHLMEMLGDGRVEVILLARVLQHIGVALDAVPEKLHLQLQQLPAQLLHQLIRKACEGDILLRL